MNIALYIGTAILAVAIGYSLQLTEACLYVGREISTSGSNRGFQDAVTPSEKTTWSIIVWILLACSIGFGFYTYGLWVGLSLIVELFLVAGICKALLPKLDSSYWVRLIYGSLARRTANYAKKNDHMRAEATLMLAKRLEVLFAEDLSE